MYPSQIWVVYSEVHRPRVRHCHWRFRPGHPRPRLTRVKLRELLVVFLPQVPYLARAPSRGQSCCGAWFLHPKA